MPAKHRSSGTGSGTENGSAKDSNPGHYYRGNSGRNNPPRPARKEERQMEGASKLDAHPLSFQFELSYTYSSSASVAWQSLLTHIDIY